MNSGIETSSLSKRESYFGSNKKDPIELKGFFVLLWEALKDLLLRILLLIQ